MTDAILDGESVLEFVTRHYEDLKNQAQDDNTPSNASITAVIDRIDTLYKTITTKGEVTHDEIVKQLKELKTQYNNLGPLLGDDIVVSYTRYIDANTSLSMVVDGLEEVEAVSKEAEEAEEGAGEPIAPKLNDDQIANLVKVPVHSDSSDMEWETNLLQALKTGAANVTDIRRVIYTRKNLGSRWLVQRLNHFVAKYPEYNSIMKE